MRVKSMKWFGLKTAVLTAAVVSLIGGCAAQSQVQQAVSSVGEHDISLPLREMAAMTRRTRKSEKEVGELDEKGYCGARPVALKKVGAQVHVKDAIVQRSQPTKLATTHGLSFDGVPGVSYKVPDTNGAVGAT